MKVMVRDAKTGRIEELVDNAMGIDIFPDRLILGCKGKDGTYLIHVLPEELPLLEEAIKDIREHRKKYKMDSD